MARTCCITCCPRKPASWYRGLQRFGYLPIFALIFLFRPAMSILLYPALTIMNLLNNLIAPYQVGLGGIV